MQLFGELTSDDVLSAASRALRNFYGARSWGCAALHPRLYAADRFAGYESPSRIADSKTPRQRRVNPLECGGLTRFGRLFFGGNDVGAKSLAKAEPSVAGGRLHPAGRSLLQGDTALAGQVARPSGRAYVIADSRLRIAELRACGSVIDL